MLVRNLIGIFVVSFNYLNDNNKRAGIILFSNHQLTRRLESLALSLKNDALLLMSQVDIADEDKATKCCDLIRDAFNTAKEHRIYYATWKKHISETEAYEYKISYKPSKFEKELCKAMREVVSQIIIRIHLFADRYSAEQVGLLSNFKYQLEQLCEDIELHNSHEQIVKKDSSRWLS